MKLAVAGKGGSGKTVLVALLARALSERGLSVLAVDLDSNPGLALSLGVSPEDTPLPDAAVEQRPDVPYGWTLAGHLSPAEAVRRYGVRATERIVFFGLGNIARLDHPLPRFLTAVRRVTDGFDEPRWAVVADLGGGPTNAFEGYANFASLVLVAVEANPASVGCAESLLAIFGHEGIPAAIVVTKARPGDELLGVAGLEPLAVIPYDPEVRRLERTGSLAALGSASPALDAVRQLVAGIHP